MKGLMKTIDPRETASVLFKTSLKSKKVNGKQSKLMLKRTGGKESSMQTFLLSSLMQDYKQA